MISKSICASLAAMAMVLAAGSALATPITTVAVELLPSLVVPPVVSSAAGSAEVSFDTGMPEDGITFEIMLEEITTPLLSGHIHLASAGQNGGVGALLFSFCTGPVCGPSEVEIFGDQITIAGPGVLVAQDFATVIAAILSGNAYVDIHTEFAPAGELRGNFVPEPSTATLLGLGLLGLARRGRQRS